MFTPVSRESSASAGFSPLSESRCQRGARNRWDLCLLMSSTVFSFFQKNNGAHASEGPCQAGFSQSFYSLLVSKDVLKGGGVRKGEWHRRRPASRFQPELSPLLVREGGGCHVGVCKVTLGVLADLTHAWNMLEFSPVGPLSPSCCSGDAALLV